MNAKVRAAYIVCHYLSELLGKLQSEADILEQMGDIDTAQAVIDLRAEFGTKIIELRKAHAAEWSKK